MSSFDDALRRRETEQRNSYARQQSIADQRYHAAAAAVPAITHLLWEFSQRLRERGVRPRRMELAGPPGRFRLPKHSPDGYVLHVERGNANKRVNRDDRATRLTLVTPDGHLWRSRGGFVLISPETVLGGTADTTLYIDGYSYITFGPNGEALVHRNGDPPVTTALADYLAGHAVRLIDESTGRR